MNYAVPVGFFCILMKLHHDLRFCTTGLPSDVAVEIGEMSFNLHKVQTFSTWLSLTINIVAVFWFLCGLYLCMCFL